MGDFDFQASFIPKKPIAVSGQAVGHRSFSIFGLYSLISIIMLVVAGGMSAGVYFYEKSVKQSIEEDKIILNKAKEAFDPEILKTLSRLDSRLEVSQELLNKHITVTALFGSLEQSTLKNVRFKTFDFSLNGNTALLTMKGVAESFTAIALQSRESGKNKFLQSPILSNMVLDQNGSVMFDFVSSVEPSLILYSKNLKGGSVSRSSKDSGEIFESLE